MVDKNFNTTTQLPISTTSSQNALFMHGSEQEFINGFFKLLEEVPMNKLEKALLEKHLEKPQECAENITDTLKRVKARLSDDRRA